MRANPASCGRDRGRGLTLLEVVVAVAIASLALVGLFRAGSGGLFASDTAARGDEAIERAQSHLAAFGRTGAVTPGELAGGGGGGFTRRGRGPPPAPAPGVPPGQTPAPPALHPVP